MARHCCSTLHIDRDMTSLALLGGVTPLRGFHSDGFINPSFVRIVSAWGSAPERGFASLVLDEPVGRYPTLTTTPKNKTINSTEGVTPKTPAVKPRPKGGKGVISETHGLLTPPMA